MEWSYVVSLVKNAVDNLYMADEEVYIRTARVLAIRGISAKTLGELEEMYYAGRLEG
jgi:hypothetical protein